jgi:hypothetical protein
MYVTHIFDLFKDDFKATSLNEMSFCGVVLPIARERLGLSFLDVWPSAGVEPTMWSAQLFPLAYTPEASFAASMEVYNAVTECRSDNLQNTLRMSFAQSFEMKDVRRDREDHEKLRLAIKAHLACDRLISILERQENECLDSVVYECVSSGHIELLLRVLDFEAAQASQDVASRALACIASVLSVRPRASEVEHRHNAAEWEKAIDSLSSGAALCSLRTVAVNELAQLRARLPLELVIAQADASVDRSSADGLEWLAHAAHQYEMASNVLMLSVVSTAFPL